MNTDFIYYNGKATVLDTNGSSKEIDYYDNLEEVLERENLIEILERKKCNLVSQINDIKRQYKVSKKEYIDAVLCIFFPIIIYGLSLIFTEVFGEFFVNATIGNFNLGLIESIIFSFLTTPVGIMLINSIYKVHKQLQNQIKLKENDIQKIKRQIAMQKKKLESLKENKINTSEDNYFISRLSKEPDSYIISHMDLEKLLSFVNKDIIIEDHVEVEEKAPVLKKTLR